LIQTMAPSFIGMSGRSLSQTVSTIATMGFLYVPSPLLLVPDHV
jgi:hypothetical protein